MKGWITVTIGVVATLVAAAISPFVGNLLDSKASPDFSIEILPIEGQVYEGGTVDAKVSIQAQNQYKSPVKLLASSENPAITTEFVYSGKEYVPPYTAILKLKAAPSIERGMYTVKITGTGADGKERVGKYFLNVTDAPASLPKPNIQGKIEISASEIKPGELFNLNIVVTNNGTDTASKTRIYGRAEPGGYFAIVNSSHNLKPLVPAGWTLDLGDLKPRDTINITVAMKSQQTPSTKGMNVKYLFSYDYSNKKEADLGEVALAFGLDPAKMFFYSADNTPPSKAVEEALNPSIWRPSIKNY